MPKIANSAAILAFWFDEIKPEQWFRKDPSFDALINNRFESTIIAALSAKLDDWAAKPDSCLALILVLDQFTRNIYRDTPRAFAGDDMALALALRAIDRGFLDSTDPNHRHFLLMPLMHSEDLTVQDMSLPLFAEHTSPLTLEYAQKHRDIIAKFGRFPHRNVILGRPSSDEEIEFLKQPGSSF